MTSQHGKDKPMSEELLRRKLDLWFFRDLSDEQRKSLISLVYGPGIAAEATPHAWQRRVFRRVLDDIALAALAAMPDVAEVERLREALETIKRETTSVPCDLDNYGMCIASVNNHARAALGEQP